MVWNHFITVTSLTLWKSSPLIFSMHFFFLCSEVYFLPPLCLVPEKLVGNATKWVENFESLIFASILCFFIWFEFLLSSTSLSPYLYKVVVFGCWEKWEEREMKWLTLALLCCFLGGWVLRAVRFKFLILHFLSKQTVLSLTGFWILSFNWGARLFLVKMFSGKYKFQLYRVILLKVKIYFSQA